MAVYDPGDRQHGDNKKEQGDRFCKKDRQAAGGDEQGLSRRGFPDGRQEKGDKKRGHGKSEFLHIITERPEKNHNTHIKKGIGDGVGSDDTKKKDNRE